MNFDKLNLDSALMRAVKDRGYTQATAIQAQAIPAILNRKDLLGGAQTGTGKTAAFALPILQLLASRQPSSRSPRALILTPTRELALQVTESFHSYGKYCSLKTVSVFGGVNINPQISALKRGVDVVVATPGRLLDLLGQRAIDLSKIEIFTLDEADRMLDMGFIRDIRKVISYLPAKRQNLLFSATFCDEIFRLAQSFLKNPVNIEVARRNAAVEEIEQRIHRVDQKQKRHLLAHLIKEESWYQVLVFVRTKHGANRLAGQLDKAGISSAAIHGNKSQSARTRALESFKSGKIQTLIATDIAARGIHLEELSHVVNFDLPNVAEDYVHRIGRTGRAGKTGTAVAFVSSQEEPLLRAIEKVQKKKLPATPVEGFVPVELPPQEASQGRENNRRNDSRRSSGQGSRGNRGRQGFSRGGQRSSQGQRGSRQSSQRAHA